MTRKQAKELLPAIQHFANGGELWWCDGPSNVWNKQIGLFIDKPYKAYNIIEDQHFEARKHYALCGEVEILTNKYTNEWQIVTHPQWGTHREYRPKPKEVYEWQYTYFQRLVGRWDITEEYYTVPESGGWVKFEPSKRLRKEKIWDEIVDELKIELVN